MRVPLSWLKEFIDLKVKPVELENILTSRGLEIESIENTDIGEVIDIELTPNRGDCASIIGIARELAAYAEKDYARPEIFFSESTNTITDTYKLNVIEKDKCPRYFLKLINNVRIGGSPDWLKKRLASCGIRPLNNIVDITNYVLLETGQPLHAFDAEKIKGNQIIIRNAHNGEEILTLDGNIKKLSDDDLIIADENDPIALAGIIGGEKYSISEYTTNILLESAFFKPEPISRTERRLEIKTESSYRFTRHIDIEGVQNALSRATHLIQKIAGGHPAKSTLEFSNIEPIKKEISLEISKVSRVLGKKLTVETVKKHLASLEFKIKSENKDNITVIVPSYRNDVMRPIDLIEEIARSLGYDNIEPNLPESVINTDLFPEKDLIIPLENILRTNNYWQTLTHTLISNDIYEKILGNSIENIVEIENPINIYMNILRPDLFQGLLVVAKYNINQKLSPIKFYERGSVFSYNKGKYSETPQLAFIAQTDDYFEAKGLLESFLTDTGQDYDIKFKYKSEVFNDNQCGAIKINNIQIGEFGVFNTNILKYHKLSNLSFIGGFININGIESDRIKNRKFIQWTHFPSVLRDLSLVVPANLTHYQIYDKIISNSRDLLKKISLFDIYIDEKLGQDKKSMTYSLEFNSKERTLKAEEIDNIIQKILEDLKNKFGITLRPE